MNAIAQVLYHASNGKDFYLLLGDFLDSFYRAGEQSRLDMINDSPPANCVEAQPIYSAFAASVVHKLANDYKLPVPAWVYQDEYYLSKPYFGGDAKGSLRWWFMYKSPPEFKHRNLFVCENVLKRV